MGAASSVGRAPRSQRGGRGFEPHAVHQIIPFGCITYSKPFSNLTKLTFHNCPLSTVPETLGNPDALRRRFLAHAARSRAWSCRVHTATRGFREVTTERLPLRHGLWFETAVAIARRSISISPKFAAYCLRHRAIAGVATAPALGIVLGVAELLFHLTPGGPRASLSPSFEKPFSVDGLGAAGVHLVHQDLLEILGILHTGGNRRFQ